MLPLLAPILAQLVTLNVGDRTDVRYLHGGDTHSEGATRPFAGLNFGWRRSSLSLGYSPSFTLTPLEREPRNLVIFQGASISGAYQWKRTSLSLSESVGYGNITFQVQALADPGANAGTTPATGGTATPPANGAPTPGGTTGTPPGGAPATPGGGTGPTVVPQTTKQIRRIVHYGSSTTSLNVGHSASREVALGAGAAYTVAGGLGASQDQYPFVKGATAFASASHSLVLDRRDTLSSSVSTQYNVSSLGNRVLGVSWSESWSHRIGPRTSTHLGGGAAGNRLSQDNGLVAYSIYPTFNAGIVYSDRLGGGSISLTATASAAPFLDPLRATVDPRLGVGTSAAWSKKRFGIGLGAGAAISLTNDNHQGAVNSIGASLGAAYLLGAGFSIDGGASTGWQTFEGITTIPVSWSAFLGLSFGAHVPLNGH